MVAAADEMRKNWNPPGSTENPRVLAYDAAKGSILENARAAGMPAPFACKAGVCATCKAKVIEGEVRMKTNYGLAPEDLAQGFVLTCQAFPISDKVVLDYDV